MTTDTSAVAETTETTCATLVPQIIAAHEAIGVATMEGQRSALDRAIECGRLLTLAKEAVTKGKARAGWQKWLAENFGEYAYNECKDTGCRWPRSIPPTTASLYMRLYEHQEELRAAADRQVESATRCLNPDASVRWANELIKNKAAHDRRQKRTPEEQAAVDARFEKMRAAAKKKKEEAAEQAEAKPTAIVKSPGSPDLEALLPIAAPDEVFKVIKATWDRTQINELVQRCVEHLKQVADDEKQLAA